MNTTWRQLVLNKFKELGEQTDNIVFDEDQLSIKNIKSGDIDEEIFLDKWNCYPNIGIRCVAYSDNYIITNVDCEYLTFATLLILKRNPNKD